MNRKLELVETEVDNPFFTADHPESSGNPRKYFVTINKRESALVTLYTRHLITELQFFAGIRFSGIWDTMNGKRGGSFGEHVDGYRQAYIPDSVIDAGRELKRCRAAIHLRRTYRLVCEVCGHGRSISETSFVWDPERKNKDVARRMATQYLRDGLDDLAYMWGLTHRKVVDKQTRLSP